MNHPDLSPRENEVTNRAEMVARLLGVPAPVRDPVGLLTSCPRCGYDLTGGVAS